MKIQEFKDLVVKRDCPVCGNKLKPFDVLMYNCDKKHFNGYGLGFGVKNEKVEYVYFDLNKAAHKNARKHYLFFSFQLNFIMYADTKKNCGWTDKYMDLPIVNFDLSKIPGKDYEDYFKTFVIFA